METQKTTINTAIIDFCRTLVAEFELIPDARKETLLVLRNYIQQKFTANETPQLVVICTHNSRRSHIGQLWLAVGADYFQLPKIQTFSGGTEATAFNHRAVKAFQRIGFDVEIAEGTTENPRYQMNWRAGEAPYEAFSKKYDSAPNPTEKFGAIMVCSEADADCPIVLGCDFRLSLPYDDPKAFDGTGLEEQKYDERVQQIGRELLFVLSQVKEA